MSVDALRIHRCRRWVEGLPATVWLGVHAGLYLLLTAAAVVWVGPFDFSGLLFTLVWGWPTFALLTAGFGTCLGLLRALSDLPWYAFRALTLLFFVTPLPLLMPANATPREAVAATVVQTVMAAVLVQPRRHWATQDPSTDAPTNG